eukprot:13566907-Alexandrium_andersonii.AAC.1
MVCAPKHACASFFASLCSQTQATVVARTVRNSTRGTRAPDIAMADISNQLARRRMDSKRVRNLELESIKHECNCMHRPS